MERGGARPPNSSRKRCWRSVKLCEGCLGNSEIRRRLHWNSGVERGTHHTTHCTLHTSHYTLHTGFKVRTPAWASMLVYVLKYRRTCRPGKRRVMADDMYLVDCRCCAEAEVRRGVADVIINSFLTNIFQRRQLWVRRTEWSTLRFASCVMRYSGQYFFC